MTMREIRPIMTAARRAYLTRLLDGDAGRAALARLREAQGK